MPDVFFRYTPYWRLLEEPEPMTGQGVLDTAMVETAAYALEKAK